MKKIFIQYVFNTCILLLWAASRIKGKTLTPPNLIQFFKQNGQKKCRALIKTYTNGNYVL